jgi:hypothetical protein
MKRFVATLLLAIVTIETASLGAVDGDKAAYFGGTFTAFAGAKDPIQGILDTGNVTALVLTAESKPYKGQALTIPYASVIDLEYGQKAGRRVGAAIGTSLLLGPIGLVTLFSKKRNHFLTIGYKDAQGMDQVAVIELGKDIVRTTLPIVEKRSGKSIEYQDEEARKASKG